jgi:hypothetical protein
MNLILSDDVIQFPKQYVQDILDNEFVDIYDGVNVFKNIQPRDHNDEFALFVLDLFSDYQVVWNFIRKSPKGQEEPNFVHTDEMMGDMTAILYLSEEAPDEDGTTIYDFDMKQSFVAYSKFNRAIVFDSALPHSRNIYENFGEGESSRLIQVIFLKEKK